MRLVQGPLGHLLADQPAHADRSGDQPGQGTGQARLQRDDADEEDRHRYHRSGDPQRMTTWDAILIGGGHNGLVCSAYLARAGKKVLVLERRGVLGGAAVTEEFHPGFRNSVASYTVSLLQPKVIDDLRLHAHGLRIVARPANNFLPLPDGRYLLSAPGRTQAEGANDEELTADLEYLRKLWASVQAAARPQPAPVLLHQGLTLAQRVLRDMVGPGTGTILVDSRTTSAAMLEWARIYTPSVVDRIQHYSGERPLFDTANVDDEIARALSRRVDLKSGGYLIIDQTEALTTVDVNTGGFVGGRNFDDTIFKTNLEAAQAIARQLRLRPLGGIVILDFIDMEEQEHRDTVLAELKKAL
ncbi:hypothetical protein G6F68_010735 [Rhizopus microsporus]|nr:hypothetical protein G6F68_010735 [Rhizopus microsporus]